MVNEERLARIPEKAVQEHECPQSNTFKCHVLLHPINQIWSNIKHYFMSGIKYRDWHELKTIAVHCDL